VFRYYKATLLSLFRDIQKLAANPTDVDLCFSIQYRLIKHIKSTERKIQSLRKDIAELQKLKRHGRLKKEQSNRLKSLLQHKQEQIEEYHKLLFTYRDVGDSIAHIYLNKWDIKPLSVDKAPPGFLTGKKGFRLEHGILKKSHSWNVIAILNDITHCLRYGDITVPKDGFPLLIEAKSGKSKLKDAREIRQSERANKVLNYLMTDKVSGLYEQVSSEMMRKNMHHPEKNNASQINQLIENALRTKQNVGSKIESALYYFVILDSDEVPVSLQLIPKDAEPYVFYTNFLIKNSKGGYYPPPLIITEPDALYRFYTGDYAITVVADIKEIREMLHDKGIKVSVLNDGVCCLQFDYRKAHAKVSNHFFGRLGGEFLSLQWLIDETVISLKNLPKMFPPEQIKSGK
jgi:hypothetical protein